MRFPVVTNACPNWQAKVENGQASGWDYQLNPQNIEVVSDPQDTKSQVIKLTITPDSIWPNGHTRTETKPNITAAQLKKVKVLLYPGNFT